MARHSGWSSILTARDSSRCSGARGLRTGSSPELGEPTFERSQGFLAGSGAGGFQGERLVPIVGAVLPSAFA
ncbi:MAG: hypothetical protein ACI8QS_003058 [Planctomycetota bacterium]|jgi:hypothetical protein